MSTLWRFLTSTAMEQVMARFFFVGGGGVLLNYTCLVELYRAPLNMEVPKVSLFSHIIDFGEIIFPSND